MSALASDSNGNKSFSMESLAVPGVDPFFLSETKEKQDDVFRALFKENDSYKMKGTVEDIRKYWDVIREGYFSVLEAGACKSYHTLTHAIDVSVTCHSMLMAVQISFTILGTIGMVLAAFAHDVLHPGMSNGFT